MSFYLARLEAAREQHRMVEAAAAAAAAAAHAPRAWPPPYQYAGLLPLPRPLQHHHHHLPVPPPPAPLHAGAGGSRVVVDAWRGACSSAARRERDDGAPERAGASLGYGAGSMVRRERDDGAPLRAGASLGDGARGGIVARRDDGAPSRAGASLGDGSGSVARREDSAPFRAGGLLGEGAGSVARCDDGAPSRAGASLRFGYGAARGGVAGSATGASETVREETGRGGGEEVRNKRPLEPMTPRPRSPPPPPKRRAVAAAARRLFPPGCGRDAAPLPPLANAYDGDASRSVAAAGGDGRGGGSGAPHKWALLPHPRHALVGGKVDRVFSEATSSPSAAAAAAVGSTALKKVPASNGAAGVTTDDSGHHCQGERLVKLFEAVGRNGVAAAVARMDAAASQGVAVAGQGSGELSKCKDCLVPSMRLMPKPTTVSANRRFPPGCRRLGAPLPAGDGATDQVACLPSPEEEAQESHVSSSVTVNHATDCVGEAYASHTSSGEIIGNRRHCEEMSSSAVPAIVANVTSKPGGGSCNVAASESLAQGLSKESHKSESVSECAALNTTCSDDFAAAVSGEGAVMRKKVMHTARKSVKPPRLIQESVVNTQHRPFFKEIERETELGWNTNMNDTIEDTGVFTKDRAIQDPMSANKSPWTNEKEVAFFGPKKRVSKKKLRNKWRVTVKGRPTSTSRCALDDKEDSILEDEEIFKALAAQETKFEFGPQTADARCKVKLICTRFESICRAIVQAAGQRSVKVRRIDLAADKLIRKLPGFTKQGPVVGSVPGVEVGDEFLYRVQLALVGLHRPFQGGIDSMSHEKTGVRIAISVVASGGYPDELLSCSGELVYTGSGQKDNGDQKLENGNLALKNCIEMKTPVRVIHGFKDWNREEGSHSRAREISTFTYDGLYHVVDCWREGSPGSKVFKYKLQRIPGQPQLTLHTAKGSLVKNSLRPGFVFTWTQKLLM